MSVGEAPKGLNENQCNAQGKNSGNYRVIQFGLVPFMMLVFAAEVVVSWGYGLGTSDSESAIGDGLVALLVLGLFTYAFYICSRSGGGAPVWAGGASHG